MPVKVKYVGPLAEVEIAAAPGVLVKRRGNVEVPRNVADELVRSGDFKRVVERKPPAEQAGGSDAPGDEDEDEVEDDEDGEAVDQPEDEGADT